MLRTALVCKLIDLGVGDVINRMYMVVNSCMSYIIAHGKLTIRKSSRIDEFTIMTVYGDGSDICLKFVGLDIIDICGRTVEVKFVKLKFDSSCTGFARESNKDLFALALSSVDGPDRFYGICVDGRYAFDMRMLEMAR